jgi:hypothetical protein
VLRNVPTVKQKIIFKAISSLKFLDINILISKEANVIKKFDNKLFIFINLTLCKILNDIFVKIFVKNKYERKIKLNDNKIKTIL